eukprot:6177071-Pleurochrysis_carterae.AAC.7
MKSATPSPPTGFQPSRSLLPISSAAKDGTSVDWTCQFFSCTALAKLLSPLASFFELRTSACVPVKMRARTDASQIIVLRPSA